MSRSENATTEGDGWAECKILLRKYDAQGTTEQGVKEYWESRAG